MSDNLGRAKCHLKGPGLRSSEKQFSIHVSRTLDCLGKSKDMVKHRVKMYRELQSIFKIIKSPIKSIITGSKGEGLTAPWESDHDQMYVVPDVILVCADDVRPFSHNRNTMIFQTERHNTPAGYTKLKLIQEGDYCSGPLIQDSLFQNANEERYMSSDLFMAKLKIGHTDNDKFKHHSRSGPSYPISTFKEGRHADLVYAFCCVCPDLLQSFITRPRLYNRPSRSILDDISKMESHVVPVGSKESENSYQEWRICFTEAEIYLLHHFNTIETKVYILLKMIAKLVTYISNTITSYVMKNIALWLVELYPADMFTEELLTTQLLQALIFLKKCVEVNFLPSYMIPDRNLLAGRMTPIERRSLTAFLSLLIHEKDFLLLRCEKLRVCMVTLYREPDMAVELRWRRDMLEKLDLLKQNMELKTLVTECLSEEQAHELLVKKKIYTDIFHATLLIISPEWHVMRNQGYNIADLLIYAERKILLLS